ncbi:unnamed protein product, partial [Ascophyllum nodosum]
RATDGYKRSWTPLPPLADWLGRLLPVATPRLPRVRAAATTLRADAATREGPPSRRLRTATTAIHGIKAAIIRIKGKAEFQDRGTRCIQDPALGLRGLF